MMHWLTALASSVQGQDQDQAQDYILVTVAKVAGSAPREAGAKMLVTATQSIDTIGGGHLEMRALEIAREMLARPETSPNRRLERFPLGPSLGQCCGGVVHLSFERISCGSDNCAHFALLLQQRWSAGLDSWRLVPLDSHADLLLCDETGTCLTGTGMPASLLPPAKPEELSGLSTGLKSRRCTLLIDEANRRWLLDPCLAFKPHLMLFGAGHVGTAIVQALAGLPCQVTWVDAREELFPATLPANVRLEITDTPEALVEHAAANISFLVSTHSHAIDQRLCEQILRRTHFCWFGLIGSMTKRMQFEHRLQERGIPAGRLRDMVCPIGLKGITGKQPAVIAASVAAQLLQVWETFEQGKIDNAAEVDAAASVSAIISPADEVNPARVHRR